MIIYDYIDYMMDMMDMMDMIDMIDMIDMMLCPFFFPSFFFSQFEVIMRNAIVDH